VDLADRCRQDLSGRCVHWLRTLLAYRLPPGAVLELGCGHGGLVALARQAGYHATGLELGPRAADFARQAFQVPVLHGPLETQDFPAGSQDVIVLNDVLGRVSDPVATLECCGRLLRDDGILVVQAPDYPRGKTYEELVAGGEPTLAYLNDQAGAYRYLFSQCAVRRLFERLGFGHLGFERPIFPYDLFAVVSRHPLVRHPEEHVNARLTATPQGRLVRALFDLQSQWRAAEDGRAAHLDTIARLGQQLAAGEADRATLRAANAGLRERLAASEADRAARLDTVHRLNVQLTVTQGELTAVREMVGLLGLDTLERVGGHLEAAAARLATAEARLADAQPPGKPRRLSGKLRRLVRRLRVGR
jgi:SAM-dependent methyltransferase